MEIGFAESFLQSGQPGIRRPSFSRPVTGVATLLLIAGAFMAATRHHVRHIQKTLQSDVNLDGSALTCWSNTGGTCRFWGCRADRGTTECSSSSWCVCPTGFCATINGSCAVSQQSTGTIVATDFKMTNLKWPSYKLYADSCDDALNYAAPLSISDSETGAKVRWSLIRIGDPYSAETGYLLTPMAFPDCVVADIQDPVVVRKELSGIDGSAITLQEVPNRTGVFSMHSVKQQGKYFYVPSFTSHLALYPGDATDAGMWQTDPPLPASVWS